MTTLLSLKELIPSKEAETSQTEQYTAEGVNSSVISIMSATNTTGSALTLSVNLIPDGDSVGDGNLISKDRSIPAGRTVVLSELGGQVLESGGVISTIASGAGITIRCSGIEYS